MDRFTDRDATYHRWGGQKPALRTWQHRSPLAHMVGKTVVLACDMYDRSGVLHPAGTRAKVVQAWLGLILQIGDEKIAGVEMEWVKEATK